MTFKLYISFVIFCRNFNVVINSASRCCCLFFGSSIIVSQSVNRAMNDCSISPNNVVEQFVNCLFSVGSVICFHSFTSILCEYSTQNYFISRSRPCMQEITFELGRAQVVRQTPQPLVSIRTTLAWKYFTAN